MKRVIVLGVSAFLGAVAGFAQEVPKALQSHTQGFYWAPFGTNSLPAVQKLDLTADQKKSVDDIFQQHRLKLIDLEAALQKDELILEPLVAAVPPDDAKVLAQIDRVAQARAELEKANSRMLWQVRRVLTPEQWSQLQAQPRLVLKTPAIKQFQAPKVTVK